MTTGTDKKKGKARKRKEIEMETLKIVVIGVGGGGCNAINHLSEKNKAINEMIKIIAIDTDAQHLLGLSHIKQKVQINANHDIIIEEKTIDGVKIEGRVIKGLKGLSCGGDSKKGWKAAEENREIIANLVKGVNIVFIAAGLGRGTGTGAAPVIAEIARKAGALVIAVVTKPFLLEGRFKMELAEEGIKNLLPMVDSMVIIPNQKIMDISLPGISLKELFYQADETLAYGVRGISDLIQIPGEINLDYADLVTIIKESGASVIGIGEEKGENINRTLAAAEKAIMCPFIDGLDNGVAMKALVNITGGDDLTLAEIDAAANYINGFLHDDTLSIFGAVKDSNMTGTVRITVFLTDIQWPRSDLHVVPNPAKAESPASNPTPDKKPIVVNSDDMDTPAFLRAPTDGHR